MNGNDMGRPAAAGAATLATNADVSEIKADIERTQADLAANVAALQRKLSPSYLLERAKGTTRETLRAWGHTGMSVASVAMTKAEDAAATAKVRAGALTDQARVRARNNPAPVVLIGAGLAAALWHGARRQRRLRALSPCDDDIF